MSEEHETAITGFSNWAPVVGPVGIGRRQRGFNGPQIRPEGGPGLWDARFALGDARNGSASVTVAIESTPERTAIPADFADRVPTPRTTAKRALAARNDRNGKVLFALR